MDWKDSLGALLASGTLPEGEEANNSSQNDSTPAKESADSNKKKPIVNVVFERKGRGGKSATIIEGFGDTDDVEIEELSRFLKTRLGIGGSARGGEILLQGDQRSPKLKKLLADKGFKSKGI